MFFFMDLFQKSPPVYEPLASRMRPRTLEEYVGQDHILGPGRLLRRAIQADQLSSLLFSGPPGTGKTTLAKVIAATTKSSFLSLNAVLSGVKEIRELIDQAQDQRALRGKKTILFVDEVHRWNKAQQDALLPWVENGTFILIGATTENPYFEVNAALVSRSRIFLLKSLNEKDLMEIALQALKDKTRGYGQYQVEFETGALEHLVKTSAGDARSLLNALELAVQTSVTPFPPAEGQAILVTRDAAEESIQKKAVLYDKDGDYHFDTISAFIKSIRGSDPDAALYWLAKMVRAGEDPQFILRRMLISASEDIGLADPQALSVVASAAQAYHHVGLPEGQFHLAQAALYLATCPKSNSTMGYFEALKTLEEEAQGEVPDALKDAHRDKKSFGHGAAYQYPHAFQDHWVAQKYLPSGLKNQIFYKPGTLGYEGKLVQEIQRRREALLQLVPVKPLDNGLTYAEESADPWVKRLNQAVDDAEARLRDELFEKLALARHHLVWITGDRKGFSIFQALRKTPEGRVYASFDSTEQIKGLQDYLQFVPELSQPVFLLGEERRFQPDPLVKVDRILGEISGSWTQADIQDLCLPLAPGGKAVLYYQDPLQSQKLSDFFQCADESVRQIFLQGETDYLTQKMGGMIQEDSRCYWESFSLVHDRLVSEADWKSWWDERRQGGLPGYLWDRFPQLQPFLEAQKQRPWPTKISWKRQWNILVWTGDPQ